MSQFRGVLPAVLTPLRDGEEFAPAAFERLLERLYDTGVHGMYVSGQTGEGLLQPVSMRRQVTEVAARNTPRGRSVIIHVGAASTTDAVALARHAASCGVSAVSALPPAGSYSFREVKAYYEAIAAAAGIPLLVYYFPEVSRAIASLDHILELCAIPGVIGLKFTYFDLYKLSLIRRAGHTIFSGRD